MAGLLRPSRFHPGANQFALHAELERGECHVPHSQCLRSPQTNVTLPHEVVQQCVPLLQGHDSKTHHHLSCGCGCSSPIHLHRGAVSSCSTIPATLRPVPVPGKSGHCLCTASSGWVGRCVLPRPRPQPLPLHTIHTRRSLSATVGSNDSTHPHARTRISRC